VKEIDRDGMKYLCYHTFTVKNKTGSEEKTALTAKQTMDKETYLHRAAIFAKIAEQKAQQTASHEPALKRPKLKALEDILSFVAV
jgi:hypothetical protein